MMLSRFLILVLLCSHVAIQARSQEPASSTGVAHAVVANDDYLINVDDVIDVYLVDVPELSRTYRVAANGSITIPLLTTPLRAGGMTLGEFSSALSNQLRSSGLVSSPQLTVSVKESRLSSVAITGAVKKPQIYSVLARTTLLDVIAQAEGLADDASSLAIVRRGPTAVLALKLDPADEAGRTTTVDVKRLLETGDSQYNVAIYPGDRITIPRAGIVYVVGAVNRPGGFPMKQTSRGMTVLQALAVAEDMKTTAVPAKSVIIRVDATAPGGKRQIPIDVKKVLAGKQNDEVLTADDILFIPDSSSKRLIRRGAEAIVQVATGVAIYRR